MGKRLRRYWLIIRHLREAECRGLCGCGCGKYIIVIHGQQFAMRSVTYRRVVEAVNG